MLFFYVHQESVPIRYPVTGTGTVYDRSDLDDN